MELLLASSAKAEAEVPRELYADYRSLRERLFEQLKKTHHDIPPSEVLGCAQTIVDRVLFVAFAEDRGLLPPNTLSKAVARQNPDDPKPIWHHLKAVLRWIHGDYPDRRATHADPIDRMEVSDEVCRALGKLGDYDFGKDIPVEALGHVFERSISGLETLRRGAAGIEPETGQPSRRHDEGIYYTPAHVTRYIVDCTLGRTLAERRTAVFDHFKPEEKQSKAEANAASVAAWVAYRAELESIRVLDPACGSGVFLVAAYEALGREYERVLDELAELRGGQIEAFDVGEAILDNNLFGVDISPESVELTKLSLWLTAARHGRRPSHLDRNIKWGDSIVGDPDLSRVAFDWRRGRMARSLIAMDPGAAAIDARWLEGFDVVIGNPPYIRQELLAPIKGHLSQLPDGYASYHGMADIYVYFFERGLSVLKPHGRLGFIVANKWMRAGYGAPLRRLLAHCTEVETVVDFGHAPIFDGADAFPCIIAVRKLAGGETVDRSHEISVTAFPRSAVASQHHPVPQKRLGEEPWSLEPEAVEALYRKMRRGGVPLVELSGEKPRRGFLTGYNDAFIVDASTRRELIEEDPRSAEIVGKCLRGQDVGRWSPRWSGTFLICARRGIDIDSYPAIKRHLSKFRAGLEPRPRDHQGDRWAGRKPGPYQWYELQDAVDYWDLFARPKIVYQEIQFHPAYGLDRDGMLVNNKTFFLCSDDPWLLAVLNSPLMWWHNWRYLVHMKDEALSPAGVKMEQLPIAPPDGEARRIAGEHVPELVSFVKEDHEARARVLDALRTQLGVEAPGQKLGAFEELSRDAFIAEVTKRRPKALGELEPSDLRYLREMYDEVAAPIQERRRRAERMEKRLADRVNRAYGLTPDEVELMWSTAPPRMPVGR